MQYSLESLGWKKFFQQQLPGDLPSGATIVRVSAHFGSQVVINGELGESRVPVQLAESAGTVAVGDWLVLDQDGRSIRRLERETLLSRRPPGGQSEPQLIAANVDTIFIVCSCNQDFNLPRIERYLALVLEAGALPIVVLTKTDLCGEVAQLRNQVESLRTGLLVESLDARDAEQTKVLLNWCGPGKSLALLGSSGVGKSTLANSLGVCRRATSGVREKDGKGRHTTTVRSLHPLPEGGVLVDTPGMREIQLLNCEEGVADLFEDLTELARSCRFRDCRHEGDAGCAIQKAVDAGEVDPRRFRSFQKLKAEQAHNARSLAERRARERSSGRMGKAVMKHKRQRDY